MNGILKNNFRILEFNKNLIIDPISNNAISYITSPEHFDYCLVSIKSFLNKIKDAIEVIFIVEKMDFDLKKIKKFNKKIFFTFVLVDNLKINLLNNNWPSITPKRLILLSKTFYKYSKILSLESDIFITGEINDIFTFKDSFLYAVIDSIPQNINVLNNKLYMNQNAIYINKNKKNFLDLDKDFKWYLENIINIKNLIYYNIGVLLINYSLFIDKNILDKINDVNNYLIIDQDLLNKEYFNFINQLDYSYGFNPALCTNYFQYNKDYFSVNKIKICHFNGSIYKPWDFKSFYNSNNNSVFLKFQLKWLLIFFSLDFYKSIKIFFKIFIYYFFKKIRKGEK